LDIDKKLSDGLIVQRGWAGIALSIADEMVTGGIQANWNFAPVRLKVPPVIIVHNEDLYSSLATLSWKLAQRFNIPFQQDGSSN
jgi:NADH/NAD ratio-sensing transcriptional regulator Rex